MFDKKPLYFYRFSPIKVVEIEIDLSGGTNQLTPIFWDPQNQIPEKMPMVGQYSPEIHTHELKQILENLGIDTFNYTTSKTKSWSRQDKVGTGFEKENLYLLDLIKKNIGDRNPADFLSLRKKSMGKNGKKSRRK
jgi:hypothetical protein